MSGYEFNILVVFRVYREICTPFYFLVVLKLYRCIRVKNIFCYEEVFALRDFGRTKMLTVRYVQF